jgi:rhodanese-related sulfurtransferase
MAIFPLSTYKLINLSTPTAYLINLLPAPLKSIFKIKAFPMRYSLLSALVFVALSGFGQYKNDNVLFKTVYMDDFCAQLRSTPNAVLLDVRSKGEYEDTSTSYSLNIGRLKNTIHLDTRELPNRWRELLPYKDQPIYVMCSHSQRSRRMSKMLADSGFTNIINVNGGLTTFNLLPASVVCKETLYTTANKYSLVSPLDLCNFLSSNKDLFILDVRTDSAYNGIARDDRLNALGKINGGVNIPLATLRTSVAGVPKGKKILVVDEFGADAAQAARLLADQGYTNVHVLFNGIDMFASRSKSEVGCAGKVLTRSAKYQLVSGDEFDAMLKKEKNLKIVDVRPADEFNNKSQQTFRNIGHIRSAVNIPANELANRVAELGSDKDAPIVFYHFSGGTDAYVSARQAAEQGYKTVYVLTGGLFNLRWQAANYKGKSHLKDSVVDIPVENQ